MPAPTPLKSSPEPIAILGPTNTGKTWYAAERMLAHQSGMFGFPLRLLARENYDRAVKQLGKEQVALITGEEKIVPKRARFFMCTVEAMPPDMSVDFVAIDEVQLAADPERGHIFTDRLLNARGREETLLLGAETIKNILDALLPSIKIKTRPRLSTLSWAGQKKVTRLPRRTAVVAFSAPEIYKLAEFIRAKRGGAAIVMGALSPRTRNAQVEMFQSGAVDYMVATDAIGMGLNMDINHIALAGDVKFDGRQPRQLTSAELAQIVGRAGRHTKDGTFGITGHCAMPEAEVIEAIEHHRFRPLRGIYWRNPTLDFSSAAGLLQSLESKPPSPLMTRKTDADDQQALAALMEHEEIRIMANDSIKLARLFDICRIPDYERNYSDSHTQLLARLAKHLLEDNPLPKDWVSSQMEGLNRTDGDLDTLMSRLSRIRTWSYIAHRQGWLTDAEEMQGLAKSIEDKVSDSLHMVLTHRFVDLRAAILSRSLKENRSLMSSIRPDGTVLVEGEEVGRLDGFVFTPHGGTSSETVLAAARKVLPAEITQRVKALVASADAAFIACPDGTITWRESEIARFIKGDHLYQPKTEIKSSTLLDSDQLKAVQDRLNNFAAQMPKTVLEQAIALTDGSLTGAARGIAFQLYESLGTLPVSKIADLIKDLDEAGRRQLAQKGIRLGVDMLYMVDLLKPAQIAAKALLFSIYNNDYPESGPPPAGRVAIDQIKGTSDAYWLATGYRRLGSRVIRVDMAERLCKAIRDAAKQGRFQITDEMLSLAGATREQMAEIIQDLNYRKTGEQASEDPEKPPIPIFERQKLRPKKSKSKKAKVKSKQKPKVIDPHSPFAVLVGLKESN